MEHTGTRATALLTAAEVADRLGISKRTVRRYVQRGFLGSVRLQRLVRFEASDVEAFVEQCRLPQVRVQATPTGRVDGTPS